MRRISCDQYEFDPPDSEQSLELAIASPSRHCPDLASLFVACGASATAGFPIPADWWRWIWVGEQLDRFARLQLLHPSQLREAVLIQDDWDDVELGVAFGATLVWFHWSTTA